MFSENITDGICEDGGHVPSGVVVGMDAVGRDFIGAVEILSVDEMEVGIFGHAFFAELFEKLLQFKLPGV